MGQSYFIWKNIDCRAMGCRLDGPAPIIRPEERAEHITIPGRSGDLTMLEGENIFNSYIQTVTMMVHGGARVRKIYDWLRGSGYVTFSGEPDKRQEARVIGAITLNKHSYNLDWWEGEVQFYCQPLKELLQAKTQTVAINGTVVNTGDVDEYPVITVTPSAASCTVSVNNRIFTISGQSGTQVKIDCGAGIMYNPLTNSDLTKYTIGKFPKLDPGSNTLTGSGWSSLTLERKERFL